ncbi:MAG: trypsin-like peptidase domain-containing protein [Isosphaeraceae bacterium]
MPFRVSCPSCGRPGRLPDHAVGRSIQCPACQHRYIFTTDLAVPDGLELVEDEPETRPAPKPRSGSGSTPRPAEPRPAASSRPRAERARPSAKPTVPDDDPYATDDDDGYVEPPAWAVKPKASTKGSDDDLEPAGGTLAGATIPLKLMGGVGIALSLMFTALKAFEFATTPAAAPPPPPALLSPPLATRLTPAAPRVVPPVVFPAEPVAPPVAAVPVAAGPVDGESETAEAARKAAANAGAGDSNTSRALSTADIVAESEPSVALIKGKGSSGTGFLVAPGLLATNAHVVDGEFVSDLEVCFVSADASHKPAIKPELLFEDSARDIAFLAVKSDLKPLRIAKSYQFRKGEDVTVIGSPGMGDGQVLENAISRGVMSTRTQIDGQNFYQLGIAINPGNSGGPVFDSAGRVIGIATLKSSKQEAMGFCIPVEDLHLALGRLGSQSRAEADKVRSRHRVVNLVKALSGGGALLCLVIDVRRAAAGNDDSDVNKALKKLESAAGELDQDVFPSFDGQVTQVRSDSLIHPSVRSKVELLARNFKSIRQAYTSRSGVGDNRLRPWKQTHRRLITELSTALDLEFPKEMMVAFDDHVVTGETTVQVQPPSMGSFGSRLWERHRLAPPMMPQPPSMGFPDIPQPPTFGGPSFGPPGFGPSTIPRPPSLRDRFGSRPGLR